jgi:hypothetical protein
MGDLYLPNLAGTQRNQFRIRPAGVIGAPTTGYHRLGEVHMDAAGVPWVCVLTGTPGEWDKLGTSPSLSLNLALGVNTLDALYVDDVGLIRWMVYLRKATQRHGYMVTGTHDGDVSSDATNGFVGLTMESSTGQDIDVDIDVNVSGAGASQVISLELDAGSTGWDAFAVRLATFPA